MKIQFTEQEKQLLQKCIDQIQLQRGVKHLSFEYLMENWTKFVQDCEKGYQWPDYEYLNDLASRILLEEVLEKLDEKLRKKIEDHLRTLDEKFLNATKKIQCSISSLHSVNNKINKMLYCRIPKKMSKELKRDLENRTKLTFSDIGII